MIFVDTDILVIDQLFPSDPRNRTNKAFLTDTMNKATSIYNILELCGIASFAMNITELTKFFINFHQLYDLRVLYPKIVRLSPEEMVRHWISKIFEKICLKMNYPDAQVLLVAEEYDCSDFVTWNTKHFEGRTFLALRTPAELLKKP